MSFIDRRGLDIAIPRRKLVVTRDPSFNPKKDIKTEGTVYIYIDQKTKRLSYAYMNIKDEEEIEDRYFDNESLENYEKIFAIVNGNNNELTEKDRLSISKYMLDNRNFSILAIEEEKKMEEEEKIIKEEGKSRKQLKIVETESEKEKEKLGNYQTGVEKTPYALHVIPHNQEQAGARDASLERNKIYLDFKQDTKNHNETILVYTYLLGNKKKIVEINKDELKNYDSVLSSIKASEELSDKQEESIFNYMLANNIAVTTTKMRMEIKDKNTKNYRGKPPEDPMEPFIIQARILSGKYRMLIDNIPTDITLVSLKKEIDQLKLKSYRFVLMTLGLKDADTEEKISAGIDKSELKSGVNDLTNIINRLEQKIENPPTKSVKPFFSMKLKKISPTKEKKRKGTRGAPHTPPVAEKTKNKNPDLLVLENNVKSLTRVLEENLTELKDWKNAQSDRGSEISKMITSLINHQSKLKDCLRSCASDPSNKNLAALNLITRDLTSDLMNYTNSPYHVKRNFVMYYPLLLSLDKLIGADMLHPNDNPYSPIAKKLEKNLDELKMWKDEQTDTTSKLYRMINTFIEKHENLIDSLNSCALDPDEDNLADLNQAMMKLIGNLSAYANESNDFKKIVGKNYSLIFNADSIIGGRQLDETHSPYEIIRKELLDYVIQLNNFRDSKTDAKDDIDALTGSLTNIAKLLEACISKKPSATNLLGLKNTTRDVYDLLSRTINNAQFKKSVSDEAYTILNNILSNLNTVIDGGLLDINNSPQEERKNNNDSPDVLEMPKRETASSVEKIIGLMEKLISSSPQSTETKAATTSTDAKPENAKVIKPKVIIPKVIKPSPVGNQGIFSSSSQHSNNEVKKEDPAENLPTLLEWLKYQISQLHYWAKDMGVSQNKRKEIEKLTKLTGNELIDGMYKIFHDGVIKHGDKNVGKYVDYLNHNPNGYHTGRRLAHIFHTASMLCPPKSIKKTETNPSLIKLKYLMTSMQDQKPHGNEFDLPPMTRSSDMYFTGFKALRHTISAHMVNSSYTKDPIYVHLHSVANKLHDFLKKNFYNPGRAYYELVVDIEKIAKHIDFDKNPKSDQPLYKLITLVRDKTFLQAPKEDKITKTQTTSPPGAPRIIITGPAKR